MKPLRIALAMNWLNDGTVANFVGDHAMAESWAKYMRRREDVASVGIYSGRELHEIPPGVVVIHFWPGLPIVPGAKNILYLQNAFGPEFHPDGTVGVFNQVKGRFDGHMFVSEKLKERCGAEGAVVPFAADCEQFTFQPDDRYSHAVSFVGSDIRGDATNDRYLAPAIPHGLVIYGGPYRDSRYQAVHRGRLSAEDLPKVFSSSRVNLNITHPEHVKNGVINERAYQVLACGGFVLSDDTQALPDDLVGLVMQHGGKACVDALLPAMSAIERQSRDVEIRRAAILAKHTTAHRVETVMNYLKRIV